MIVPLQQFYLMPVTFILPNTHKTPDNLNSQKPTIPVAPNHSIPSKSMMLDIVAHLPILSSDGGDAMELACWFSTFLLGILIGWNDRQ